MSDKWYFSGPLGIGEADPYAPLVVSGEISLKSPDSGIHSLRFKRTDEDNRVHEWALWHMNKEYRKNALEIWEYKTDSSGKSCGGNPADGAMCTPRLVIQEGGNVGIGTPEPKRRLQIGDAVAGIGFEPSDGSPNAGYIRFGDQTGWRLHFGRSTESPEGALNTGTAGVLMTLQDNGNVGIGTPGPTHPLHVKTNWGFLALDTNAAGQDAGVRLMEGGTLKWHIYNAAQAKKLRIAREGLGASLTIDETGNVGIGTGKTPQQLSITGGIGFANQNAADKKLYSPADGVLEWMTHDAAGQHGLAVSHQGQQRVFLNTKGNSYLNGGNVGIGTPDPTHPLHVKTNWGFLALDTNAAGQDAGVRLMEGGTLKWHIYNAAQAKKLHIAREGLGASLTIDETGNVTIGGALVIAKPTSNDNARAILANLAEGAAIVGSAGGSHEPRIDFYFKYARRVYVASIGGRELPRS